MLVSFQSLIELISITGTFPIYPVSSPNVTRILQGNSSCSCSVDVQYLSSTCPVDVQCNTEQVPNIYRTSIGGSPRQYWYKDMERVEVDMRGARGYCELDMTETLSNPSPSLPLATPLLPPCYENSSFVCSSMI